MAIGDKTKARLVSGYDEATQPGDFWFSVDGEEKIACLTHVCPRCHGLGGMSFGPNGWTWDGNREAPTCTPSILHDKGRCGWHGFLTAGEFIETH